MFIESRCDVFFIPIVLCNRDQLFAPAKCLIRVACKQSEFASFKKRVKAWVQPRRTRIMFRSIVPTDFRLCDFAAPIGSAGGLFDFQPLTFFHFGEDVIGDGVV